MKILRAVMIAAVLFLAPVYAFSSSPGYMRISLIEGDVQIKTPEAGDWGLALVNGPLMEGDQVWVPEGGRVELQLNTGTYLRLDQDSTLQILSMDKDSSQFYLSQGHAYVFYDAPEGGVIQVDTPDASTRAFDTAIFRIDMSDRYRYTDVAVYKGYVETENQVGRTRINKGDMLSLGQNTDGEVAPMGPPDEWERWNKERNDRIFERTESSRYLPSELRAYSYDFDSSGRWVQAPDYGYVWTPTVIVGAGWAPYRHGRWVWIGGDYVWISYDPWGWAPYHYGRWVFIINTGWCWVPPPVGAVYWGPGYVGWVTTGDYVGWVPLAPGEIYYGRGYYGPHSVNITNINITEVNITNVYKNVYVKKGATIIARETFNTGSQTIVDVNENIIHEKIFAKKNLRVGTPDIKPGKANFFMSGKSVPSDKLPPKHVRKLEVKELKQSRPFIKDVDKSVMKPGAKPEKLPLKTVTIPRVPGTGKPGIQPLQPAEKVRSEAAPKEERMGVTPEKKVKPAAPEAGTEPSRERQQVKPSERKLSLPERGPAPKEDEKRVTPEKKVKPGTEAGTQPSRERSQVKPSERKPTLPERGPVLKEAPKQIMPEKKVKPSAPQVTVPAREKPQMKSLERGPALPEVSPEEMKKRTQPKKKGKPVERSGSEVGDEETTDWREKGR